MNFADTLKEMDYDELLALKSKLQEEKTSIDLQLGEAKRLAHTHGTYADSSWFSSAYAANKIKGQQLQAIQIEQTRRREERKRENRANKPISQFFMDEARQILSPDVFDQILQLAIESRYYERENNEQRPANARSLP